MNRKVVKTHLKKKPPFFSRGAIILVQRTAMKLTRKKLVALTGVSYKTISRAEKGEPVSDDVLAVVASALKLDFELLKYDPRNHQRSDELPRANVKMVVDRPFAELEQAKENEAYLKAAQDLISAFSTFIRMHIERGSTILIVSMVYEDIHRLCEGLIGGKLDGLDIQSVTIYPSYTRILDHMRRELLRRGGSAREATWSTEFILREMANGHISHEVIDQAHDLFIGGMKDSILEAWVTARGPTRRALSESEYIEAGYIEDESDNDNEEEDDDD